MREASSWLKPCLFGVVFRGPQGDGKLRSRDRQSAQAVIWVGLWSLHWCWRNQGRGQTQSHIVCRAVSSMVCSPVPRMFLSQSSCPLQMQELCLDSLCGPCGDWTLQTMTNILYIQTNRESNLVKECFYFRLVLRPSISAFYHRKSVRWSWGNLLSSAMLSMYILPKCGADISVFISVSEEVRIAQTFIPLQACEWWKEGSAIIDYIHHIFSPLSSGGLQMLKMTVMADGKAIKGVG